MLALRSTLVIAALDEEALGSAASSAADAIVIDLADPSLHGSRPEARALARGAGESVAESGRPVLVRVSDARSAELTADIEAVVGPWLTAVIVSGVEEPQDLRDADVAVRKAEVGHGMTPGTVLLVPEIDAAEGIVALGRILQAVDRAGAISLSIDGLRDDLALGPGAGALFDHAMAEVALAADAARIPWTVDARRTARESVASSQITSRAHDLGAAGVAVAAEGETRGMNSLFAPSEASVALAREIAAEWDRLRKRGERLGTVEGDGERSHLVDRRTVRRARALIEVADAIARRERAR